MRQQSRLEHLTEDPYPLARAIGAVALARQESRGGHRRSDFPATDASMDGVHLIYHPDGSIEPRRWP
jgi:L-aspartate oxidase